MKQQIQTIAYTIIILAGISCHHSKGTEIYNQLQLADSYMATKPEISLQILDSLNLTECNKDHYFALLYAQAKYRNYIKSENDSLIKAALNYYSQSDNQSMKSRAYLVASQIYSEMGDLETALRYIHMSAQSANKTADYWTQSFIQYEWGWLLRDAGNIDLSTEKFEFSLAYAKKANDTIQMLSRMRELCYNYLAKNNLEQSLSYINKGLKLAHTIKSDNNIALLYGRKSLVFYYLENYPESLRYINKALAYNSSDSLSDFNFKGRLLVLTNHLDSAEYYIERGRDTTSLTKAKLYYECMRMLREAQGDYIGALEYDKKYSECLLKIASGIERDKIAKLDKQYNTDQIEQENQQLKIKQQQSRLYILAIIVIVVMATFVTYTILSRRRKRILDVMRQQSEDISRLQQNAALLMEEKIKTSEREMALAAGFNDKNRELDAAKKLILDLKKRLLLNNRVVKKVQETIDAAKRPKANKQPEPLSDTEMSELVAAVNDCYNGFANALTAQYPSLTDSEIYLCCLIKIGLDNPGLCAILCISDSALRKRKYRLKSSKFDPVRQFETLDEAIHAIPPFLPHRDNSKA